MQKGFALKISLIIMVSILVWVNLSGCGATMEGLGKDLKKISEAVEGD